MSWSIHLGERGSVTEFANKANIEGENAIDLGVVEINAGGCAPLSREPPAATRATRSASARSDLNAKVAVAAAASPAAAEAR